jgi:hypothetical protein
MKKRTFIALTVVILSVIFIGGALFFIFRPSRSAWDIAECIGRNDDFYVWISDSQHHTHYIDSNEAQSAAEKVLDNLKLSQRSVGNYTFFDQQNMIVLEVSDHRVQYFLFNEDFTIMWAADNSWIYENNRGTQDNDTYHAGMIFNASEQYNEWGNTECAAYRVRNPRAAREFFENVCKQDTKYDQ